MGLDWIVENQASMIGFANLMLDSAIWHNPISILTIRHKYLEITPDIVQWKRNVWYLGKIIARLSQYFCVFCLLFAKIAPNGRGAWQLAPIDAMCDWGILL